MDAGLPDNATLRDFARDVPWQSVEDAREQFQKYLNSVRTKRGSHTQSTKVLWHLAEAYFPDDEEAPDGNILLSHGTKRPFVMANILGKRSSKAPGSITSSRTTSTRR